MENVKIENIHSKNDGLQDIAECKYNIRTEKQKNTNSVKVIPKSAGHFQETIVVHKYSSRGKRKISKAKNTRKRGVEEHEANVEIKQESSVLTTIVKVEKDDEEMLIQEELNIKEEPDEVVDGYENNRMHSPVEQSKKLSVLSSSIKGVTIGNPQHWKYVCYFCENPFPSRLSLNLHMVQHQHKRRVKCKVCHVEFNDVKTIMKHKHQNILKIKMRFKPE